VHKAELPSALDETVLMWCAYHNLDCAELSNTTPNNVTNLGRIRKRRAPM